MSSSARIEPLGDCALLISFGAGMNPELNALALAAAESLRLAALPGLRDIAPAYASVCVHYDPCAWTDAARAQSAYACIAARIGAIVDNVQPMQAAAAADVVEIPVCYGGAFGEDLGALAAHAGLPEGEVIRRHAAAEYRVAMLGFAPGFAYLLGLEAALHAPRRASHALTCLQDRSRSAAARPVIYPRELPGGWLLIGRTPAKLFDPARDPPALLAPGARLRFRAIDADEFTAMGG